MSATLMRQRTVLTQVAAWLDPSNPEGQAWVEAQLQSQQGVYFEAYAADLDVAVDAHAEAALEGSDADGCMLDAAGATDYCSSGVDKHQDAAVGRSGTPGGVHGRDPRPSGQDPCQRPRHGIAHPDVIIAGLMKSLFDEDGPFGQQLSGGPDHHASGAAASHTLSRHH